MRPLDRAYGLCRSLWMYYARPGGAAALDRFYRPFVPTGGLCFDIGAHVGNRTRSWSRLGARVIAVEPQGDFARFLRWLFRADPRVTILELAVAERAGTIRMQVSPRTPTVSSGSERFVAAASRVPAFAWVRWDAIIDVPATTLDELIGAYGQPDFVKIDVEGMEHEVLAGLSQPVAVVSFEFVPSAPESALASVDRLEELGDYRFNVSLGESLTLEFRDWVGTEALRSWLRGRHPESESGDVYARHSGA